MATQPTSYSFTSDFAGRIRNISLAPSPANCLSPLFEAVNNSIQAIEDRFGLDHLTEGRIEVEVIRNVESGRPTGFIIKDNGVGFTPENLNSFRTSDSRYKLDRGGKGVGRFLWLKVFEYIQIESNYEDDGTKHIRFDFTVADKDQINNIQLSETKGAVGTTVKLLSFRPTFSHHCPTKFTTLVVKLISHFLAYFINVHAPKFTLVDGIDRQDLFAEFTNIVTQDKEYTFSFPLNEEIHTFKLHSFLLPKEYSDDEKGNNALFYGAHSRSVERHELDTVLGLKRIDKDFVYFGFVESPYLNSIANQERTRLDWPPEYYDLVHRKAIELTKDFLHEPIIKIREQQAATVTQIRNEHLRFLNIAERPTEFAAQLPLAIQGTEEIFLELSRASLRLYTRKKRSFNDAKAKRLPDLDAKAKEFASQLKDESVSSLAEYMMKRKLILDVFEERLRYQDVDSEKFFFEQAVHEIICPLRETTDTLNYEEHNLWVVDDALAFYSYFASDKTIKATTGVAAGPSQEPDIAIFDLGIGFAQAGSLQPITIIEFKRPGRNDYTIAKNPFIQVRDYVTRLRNAGVARDQAGREVRRIDSTTPFMCFVIADPEPTLREMMKQFGPFYQKAGHGSYYKWDESYSIFIEVSSYSEVLASAKARHQAFFEKLGINP